MKKEYRWSALYALAQRVLEDAEPLNLTEDVRDLLSECAEDAGISPADVADALRALSTATALLREVKRRLTDGNERVMDAINSSSRMIEQGDLAKARKGFEEVLAVEVVPYFRELAENGLTNVSRLEAVARTGHFDSHSHPWQQLYVLGHRIQQGKGVELRDDMRAFLQRTAPSVAISEAEADRLLATREGAEGLIALMLQRIREGTERINAALFRMIDLEEEGRLEEARQVLRDVLDVEPVPVYRTMAEEHLAKLGEPPPAK